MHSSAMRLKWDERTPQTPTNSQGSVLVALLVEENHDSEGTNERIIATLASVEHRFLKVKIQRTRDFHRGLFWESVARTMARFTLSAEEKKRIEAAIEEKVPKPRDDWALWGVTCIPQCEP